MRVLLWLAVICHMTAVHGRVCKTIDVRNNVTDLEQLRDCTVVEGNVVIVLMEKPFVEADFEPYVFPELREVTQYMMFYRVRGLGSLGKLFPNLERIGGSALVQDFALVVYEMFSLREIGLTNLREITMGSVIILKNPKLCFADTFKWSSITRWNGTVRNYISQNGRATRCQSCPEHCHENACWNATHCQVESRSPVPGCHPLCLGDCFKPGPQGCYTCKGFFDVEGNCVEKCPNNTFIYLNRRCVSENECTSTKIKAEEEPQVISQENFQKDAGKTSSEGTNKPSEYNVIHENQCLENCPAGYERNSEGTACQRCREGRCFKWCLGHMINSTGEAHRLKGCTHISGSLEITIKSETSDAVYSVLEESLGAIERIRGYLKVTRSSVTNLNFLKNLTEINGNDTSMPNFAIIVINNENLQELWDWELKKNFTVTSGRLYFHYNPKLCLKHIYKLLEKIGHPITNISRFEIGKDSNGDKFPCNDTEIKMAVLSKTSESIEVKVPYLEDIPVLRYIVYYTKDLYGNITMFADVDECSDYGWRTKDITVDSSNKEGFYVNLTELEPYTSYVFYVTTYTKYSASARSVMYRETTLPSTPSELTRLQVIANSSSEIQLKWEPPKHINGKLEGYVISWYELKEDRDFIDQRNYCHQPVVLEMDEGGTVEESPRKELGNKSCCQAARYVPKDGFEMLCSNFASMKFPFGFPDKTKYSSCESYFYSYVYNSLNNQDDSSPDRTIYDNHIISPNAIRKKQGRNKSVSPSQNDISSDEPLVKNKFNVKVKHFTANASSTGVSLTEMIKNFQVYVIEVKVCRERDEREIEDSANNRCSKSEIVTVRTKGNEKFDAIPQHTVRHKTEKDRVILTWNPPKNPNGLVVAFEIEYRHRNIENPETKIQCLTHKQYNESNQEHHITNLIPGSYEFRIRAISLFGKGPPTEYVTFDIEYSKTISPMEIICIVVAVVVVAFLILASSYFSKPSKYKIVVADVNPNYHHILDQYEIDRDDVEFFEELGVGSFGKVYKGLWKSKNLRCAIKTVNDDATVDNESEFLVEAAIMKSMARAHFIVQLFGVVSRGRPLLVLMELMELGDLKTFLRDRREESPISNATMIKMALEIADGMAFMEALKFVHRDLAARNCMVSAELTIKVGDFGMARDIYENDYYRKRNKGFLPIRWMAPESLKDGEFTSQSDIWSYGVVLWEIVTMAEQPYQGSSNDEVLHQVIAGRRLEVPKNSPLPLKKLMQQCWRTKPAKRSSFMNIVGMMEYYHDEEFRRVAFYHSQEAVTARKGMWEYVEMQPLTEPLVGKPTSASYRLATVDEENNC